MKARVAQANHIADELVRLPPLGTPVIVLCNSNLVLAKMEQLPIDTSAIYTIVPAGAYSVAVHDVHQGSNRFVTIETSWEKTEVEHFDQSGEYPRLPVLSEPDLSNDYTGPRARLRP